MSRRPLILAAALTFATVACTDLPQATVDFGTGMRFVPAVADANDNVGLGSSIAVGADGMPFVSYFGFPEELSEGEIRTPRPIGIPSVPGVLLTGVTTEQVFDRGAVVMAQPPPDGVSIAFGPEVSDTLDLTEMNTNGTATAVGEDGTVHVAYTGPDGVWYAQTSLGGSTTLEHVYDNGTDLGVAGPVGRPGIALVEGIPMVAFAVDSLDGVEVRVATPVEDGWLAQVVAEAGRCNGCPQPGPTGIVVADDGPVVGFLDPASGALILATREVDAWAVLRTPAGAGATGLSLGLVDGRPAAALYAGGSVRLFSQGDFTEVAEADVADLPGSGDAAPTTSLATDPEGVLYVAWQDAAGVHLASGSPGGLEPVETEATQDGHAPSLAVNAEGSVFMAWYSSGGQDLFLGSLTENPDVLVANPSPSVVVSIAPAPPEDCGVDGEIDLAISASGTSFDKNCLVAPADEAFEIEFNNQGGSHNVAVFTEQGGDPILQELPFNGPATVTYPVEPLAASDYYFQCDVHPTLMFGTLAAIETGGGGGGGGGGGNNNDGG